MAEGIVKAAMLGDFGVGMGAALHGRPRNSRRFRLRGQFARAWRTLIAGTRHAIVWGDSAKHDGRFAPSLSPSAGGKVPSKNLLAFSTGPIVNESGGTTPTKTTHFVQWTDADGTTSATRLVTTTANNAFFLYRTSIGPAIPQGTYTLRCRMRSTSGTGTWSVSIGLATSVTVCSVQDLDWTDPANKAATTFESTFTYAGSGDIVIRPSLSGADIQIDRLQLYFGPSSAIPAWSGENLTGGRKGFSFPASIPLDGNKDWNLTTGTGGGWILEPGLLDHTYNAMTVMHVSSLDALNASTVSYSVALRASSRLSNVITDMFIGHETTSAPYNGQFNASPILNPRSQVSMQVLGAGLVIKGMTLSSAGQTMWADAAPVYHSSTAWGPKTTPLLHVGAGTTSTTAGSHITTFEDLGKHVMTLVWDRALSDAEYKDAVRLVKIYLAQRAISLGTFDQFWVLSGDSNWTKATGDWTQLISADTYFSPKQNFRCSHTSVGGTGLPEVYGTNPYPAAMDPAARFLATEAPILLAAAQAGKEVFYVMGVFTNDFPNISGFTAGWDAAKYDATREALGKAALALHPNITVVEATCMARGTLSGDRYTPALRIAANDTVRARIAARNDGRWLLWDIGAHPQLGDQTTADASTYLQEGVNIGIHLTQAAGDPLAAAFAKTTIQAIRAARGLS